MKTEVQPQPVDTTSSPNSRRSTPYVVALGFYAVFAARASGTVDGKLTFPLFDDAMISMTYARNLARGNGLVWNAGGERVEGITNPLWTGVMAIPHRVGVPDQFTGLVIVLVGAALLCACAALSRAIVARIAPDARGAATATTWLVLFCYPLVYWTLRGMEVGLLTALLLSAVLLVLRVSEQPQRLDLALLAAVVAGGCLTRIDFLIFVPVLAAYVVVAGAAGHRRAPLVVVLGSAAVAMLAQEAGRYLYYGRLVPNTYTLKVANSALVDRLDRGWRAAVFTFVVSMAAAAVFAGIAFWKRRSPAILLLAGCAGITLLYNMYVGGDAWEWMRYPNRYLTPGLVLLLGVAAVGAFDFAATLRSPRVWRVVAAVVAAACLLVVFRIIPGGFTLFKLPPTVEPAGQRIAPLLLIVVLLALRPGSPANLSPKQGALLLWVALGVAINFSPMVSWVQRNAAYADFDRRAAATGIEAASVTTPDASLAVTGAGNAIYFGRRAGVDILGKSDGDVANGQVRPELGFFPGHMKWDYEITVGKRHPDLIVDQWLSGCTDRRILLDAGYVDAWPRANPARRDAAPFFVLEGSPNVLWDRLHVRTRAETAQRVLGDC